jgi:uncharacterized protein YbjT (DUF2867 family)
MSSKKLIAVVGATGSQGGGLARSVLNDSGSEFAVRAITRSPQSEKAQQLRDAGAEVVQADLDDLESLRRAFEGVYGIFGVTNYWELFSPEKEIAQARNIASAAEGSGVQHIVWSTLEDSREFIPLSDDRMPTLMGSYKVPHFDSKAEADAFFANLPTTYFYTSFYWDNIIHFGMAPQPGEDGVLTLPLPMGDRPLPGIAVEDIGKCAYGIFKRPELIGRKVGVAGDHVTGQRMASGLGEVLGREVRYYPVDPEVYRGFGFPGADDLGNMFQFNRDFSDSFCAARPLDQSRELNPELKSFEMWLADRKPQLLALYDLQAAGA